MTVSPIFQPFPAPLAFWVAKNVFFYDARPFPKEYILILISSSGRAEGYGDGVKGEIFGFLIVLISTDP